MISFISDKPVLGINLIKPYSGYLMTIKELAIDMNDLTIGKKLGNGHFATIYEGMACSVICPLGTDIINMI